MKFSTKLIHGNYNLENTGATNVPIYMSNAYAHSSPQELENVFKGKFPGYVYSRFSNQQYWSSKEEWQALKEDLLQLRQLRV